MAKSANRDNLEYLIINSHFLYELYNLKANWVANNSGPTRKGTVQTKISTVVCQLTRKWAALQL